VPAEELSVILELLSKQSIRAPLSPDLDSSVSEKFKDAMNENGVLKALSQPQGRRGNFILSINAGDDLIFMDMKTASLLQVSRRECMQRKILHLIEKDGMMEWKEQASLTERDELVKKITSHPTLGVAKVAEKQWTDYEDGIEMQEAENVKNLWGVQLKKREKNAKGEELLFLDPRGGGMVGELSRKACISAGILTVVKDNDDGKESIQQAVTGLEARDELVQTIRQTLKLNLEVQ
jgi:hypothetical protein